MNNRRAVSASNKHWSNSQKLEAVTTYLIFGNVAQTARMLKIPEQTLRNWRTSDWWKEIENDLRLQDDLQLSARLKTIVGKGLDVVEDRLQNGDYVFDQKQGQLIRKPVNMRDAHKVVEDSVKRRDAIGNNQTGLKNEEATADKLLKLAQKFAELAGAAKKEEPIELKIGEVVEVDGLSGEVWVGEDTEPNGEMAHQEQSGTA